MIGTSPSQAQTDGLRGRNEEFPRAGGRGELMDISEVARRGELEIFENDQFEASNADRARILDDSSLEEWEAPA